LDHICDSLNFVVAGIDDRLHDGWNHSYPAGICHRCGIGSGFSGPKTIVRIWTLVGQDEVFGKEVFSRPERFYRIYEPFSRKGLVINQFNTNEQKGATAMKKRNMFIRCFVLLMLIASYVACASTPKQESAGEYVDDSVITTKVKSLLAVDDFLKSFQISVETYKGTVQLSGFVNSQQAVDKASEIARSVKGVKSVKNDLIVK